ncbi:MAG: FGGY family carbohydrate kinase [Candidatus Poribacteria bacterium]|nr:FGGY family carbohydrate kinase [Candidatus Poribacteria bacterium]
MKNHNKNQRLSLGLDSSTQSLSAIVINIDTAEKCFEHAIDYRADERTNCFGIGEDYILPPKSEGEAEQPPLMYLASLNAMFADMREAGVPLENIVAINTSGQQHGHVYLNRNAAIIFSNLQRVEGSRLDLNTLLAGVFSYASAPIWMTANTVAQTNHVREAVGGKAQMIERSGSDAPLRFTGAVIRRVAEQSSRAYTATEKIQLISSFIPAALSANPLVPIDIGNGCGMSLMNYRNKVWDAELIEATADGLPGGSEALLGKLPELAPPDSVVGNIATYFVERHGFSEECSIIAGSGDNPQAKVPVAGDLLSLGTSFVNMVSTDGETLDPEGYANAMYDGIGRPFMFGCRTNGAMVWDAVRNHYGLAKEEYEPAEAALQDVSPGQFMTFWQPRAESFPVSAAFDLIRTNDSSAPNLAKDYTGVIETSLAAVYVYSKVFTKPSQEPLYVTGGATGSPQIMRRVAGIWNRPVVPVEKGGAALGAAVAGVKAYCSHVGESFDVEAFSAAVLKRGELIQPNPTDVEAYHGKGNYLQRFRQTYEEIMKDALE